MATLNRFQMKIKIEVLEKENQKLKSEVKSLKEKLQKLEENYEAKAKKSAR